ncbi:MAG: GIY-YIG nuclease family protein, partial [Planctomycetaceae bacterium]|nr:GIY-YIG nuclease family protein [Planctomycetaceae bacterium]
MADDSSLNQTTDTSQQITEATEAEAPLSPAEQAKQLPTTPGVYLMKDSLDRVIYVGKAVNLRSRVSSYFTQQALEDRRTADWVGEIHHLDHIDTDSEVDALLLEARLIKDIQPRFNQELKDDKTFPYLQIRTGEDFPRIEFTRTPLNKGAKLYGPFTSAKKLRGTIAIL